MVRKILTGSALILGLQSQAFASDALIIQMPVLGYASKETKDKPKGQPETTMKTTELATAAYSGGYFQFALDKVQVYLYPFATEKKVGLGYLLGPVEAGLNLGLNSTTVDKPKSSSSTNYYGVYAVYYPPALAKDVNLEVGLNVDMMSKAEEKKDATAVPPTDTTVKMEESGSTVALSVNVVASLTKNFAYVGGLNYTMASTKITKPETAKKDTNTSTFGLNLATIRYTIN